MVTPSHRGRARLSVRERCLVGVKEWGISPIRLTDKRITKREKIGAAHGALCGPAARRITGGSCVTRVCQAKKIRDVNQLGDCRKVIQEGAAISASVIIGTIKIGGSNWSNRLRFIVIVVLRGYGVVGLRERVEVEVEGKLWLLELWLLVIKR